MATTPEFPCVICNEDVRQRQEALECDCCLRWQHRKCHSGISRPDYWKINRGELPLPIWYCAVCLPEVKYSPRKLFADDILVYNDKDNERDSNDKSKVCIKLPILESESNITCKILSCTSHHGKDILTDNCGYTYTEESSEDQSAETRSWQCSVHTTCLATILQHGNTFTKGKHVHLHPVQPHT